MKIFIDSADLKEIEKYLSWGICDGVTTNPTICLKCGVSGGKKGIRERIIEIARLIHPRPVSVEVTSDRVEEVITQAKDYSGWAESIAVKVTITDRQGSSLLPAVYRLVSEGVRVNVTAMTTFNQAILAAKTIKAGQEKCPEAKISSFISIFAGRISEEQGTEQAFQVLGNVREWLDFHEFQGVEIIVGSIRSRENVELWSQSGAHVLTVPPQIISQCLVSARTKETVAQFLGDAQKALEGLGNKDS